MTHGYPAVPTFCHFPPLIHKQELLLFLKIGPPGRLLPPVVLQFSINRDPAPTLLYGWR
jgi:hypothetical protein